MSTIHTRPRQSLLEYETTPPPPRRELTAMLVAATLVMLLSMPLPWHHRELRGGGYVVVHGIDGANWLLVIGVLAVGLAARFYVRPTGFYSKWLLSVGAFVTTLGMYGEYVDNQTHAAQVHADPYIGAGFYAGLMATAALLVSAVLAWRGAESL